MNKRIGFIVAGLLILSTFMVFLVSLQKKSGRLDNFASCLKDQGAVFYGAFWCSHCQSQKRLFEGSDKYLNYVECSTPDGKDQLKICKDKNITSYPTWEFAGTATQSGELSLEKLSEKTGCQLPK